MEGSVEAVAPAKELSAETECLKQNGASEEPVVSTNGSGDEQKEEEQAGVKRKSLEGAGDHVDTKKLKTCHTEDEEAEEADDSKDAEKESAEETPEESEKVDKENVPEADEKTTKSVDDPVAASGDVEQQEAAC